MANVKTIPDALGYGVEKGRGTAAYNGYYRRCGERDRPFVMVSEYRAGGRDVAKLTVDWITSSIPPYFRQILSKCFEHLVTEHVPQTNTRVYLHGVRCDLYGLDRETAHYLARMLTKWIEDYR